MSLLDLNSIAAGDIRGLQLDEIDFLKFFGGKGRQIDQCTGLSVPGIGCSTAVYPEVDALVQELSLLGEPAGEAGDEFYRELDAAEIRDICEEEDSARKGSTDTKTRQHVVLLKRFLRKSGLPDNIETMPVRFLVQYLRLWFVSLKRKDGAVYSVNSLVGFRHSSEKGLSVSSSFLPGSAGGNTNIGILVHFSTRNFVKKFIS